MQVRPENLQAQLQRALPALVWVHGDEPLLQIESTDTARRQLRDAGFIERHVFTIERTFKTAEVDAHTQALSLFSDQLLIELRWPGKPGREHGEWLAHAVTNLPDSVRMLVSSARIDRATLDSEWFGRIDRVALVVPVFPVDRADLPKWISQRLAAQKQRVDPETLEFISERVEGNLLAANQEIRKLALLFDAGELPAQPVREAVLNVARYDTSDLIEAMLAGDLARSLRSLHGLRAESAAEPLVLWMLADAIRTLLRVAKAHHAGLALPAALKQARLFPPRDRYFLQAFRKTDASTWLRRCPGALRLAAAADRRIKGVERGDAWSALESVILSVATDRIPVGLDRHIAN